MNEGQIEFAESCMELEMRILAVMLDNTDILNVNLIMVVMSNITIKCLLSCNNADRNFDELLNTMKKVYMMMKLSIGG